MHLESCQSYAIVGNYGNDTIALVQWAYEKGLSKVQVVSVDTGWAGEEWLERVKTLEQWVRTRGFTPIRLVAGPSFTELMEQRQDFPSTKFQWCANVLKGATLLKWLEREDALGEYHLLMGHRRASARSKENLAAHIAESPVFGERSVWHPLIDYSTEQRNALIERAGFRVLSHRSLECDPCVNSTQSDLVRLSPCILKRLEKLENKLSKKMLSATTINRKTHSDVLENMGCGDSYGCGI